MANPSIESDWVTEPQISSESDWVDESQPNSAPSSFLGNIGKDAGLMFDALKRTGQGINDLPSDIYQTGKGMIGGQDFNQTPIGQDLTTVSSAITGLPRAIYQQYQGLAAEPFKHIPGKIGGEFRQAYPENPYYEHPLNSVLALSPLAGEASSAVRTIPGVQEGANALSAGIRKNLVAPNARRALGKFPMKTATEEANLVGLDALDKGIIKNPITSPFSSSRKSMLGRVNELNDSIGEHIGSFLKGQKEGLDATKAMSELDKVKERFMNDPGIVSKVEEAKKMISGNSSSSVQNPIIQNQAPQSMEFTKANKLKGLFQKKVNYLSDSATQEGGKAIAGNFRNSIDSQLEDLTNKLGNREGMASFKTNKKDYGSTSKMQDVLEDQVNRDSRNMPISLPSIITGGVGTLAGGPIKGALSALGAQWIKQYGNATAASMLNDVSKVIKSGDLGGVSPAVGAIAPISKKLERDKAKEYLKKANGNKAEARKMAEYDGYIWEGKK